MPETLNSFTVTSPSGFGVFTIKLSPIDKPMALLISWPIKTSFFLSGHCPRTSQ